MLLARSLTTTSCHHRTARTSGAARWTTLPSQLRWMLLLRPHLRHSIWLRSSQTSRSSSAWAPRVPWLPRTRTCLSRRPWQCRPRLRQPTLRDCRRQACLRPWRPRSSHHRTRLRRARRRFVCVLFLRPPQSCRLCTRASPRARMSPPARGSRHRYLPEWLAHRPGRSAHGAARLVACTDQRVRRLLECTELVLWGSAFSARVSAWRCHGSLRRRHGGNLVRLASDVLDDLRDLWYARSLCGGRRPAGMARGSWLWLQAHARPPVPLCWSPSAGRLRAGLAPMRGGRGLAANGRCRRCFAVGYLSPLPPAAGCSSHPGGRSIRAPSPWWQAQSRSCHRNGLLRRQGLGRADLRRLECHPVRVLPDQRSRSHHGR